MSHKLPKPQKKLYYISAEFLIGKLLINNMIDLGITAEHVVEAAKASIAEVEAAK